MNCAFGTGSLINNIDGRGNCALGTFSLLNNYSGNENSAFGLYSLYENTGGTANTALGAYALYAGLSGADTSNFYNCTGVGYQANVSDSNQVQLGNSDPTVLYYNIQGRSDGRDKTDIRDTRLGLDFICALHPVDYRWDLREDYRPPPPDRADFQTSLNARSRAPSVKLSSLTADGTHARTRFHHGLIAQEVKAALAGLDGVDDFGGYQDHSIKGGDDVLSLGYTEFIGPLIKAVQELKARVEVLEGRAPQ